MGPFEPWNAQEISGAGQDPGLDEAERYREDRGDRGHQQRVADGMQFLDLNCR